MVRGFKSFLFNMPSAIREMRNSRFLALEGLSFEVKAGQSMGIIGKNGAGKSTILALIAGVMRPTRGRVEVAGRITSLLELGSGFHPDLTGKENIILNGVLLGLTRREVIKRMDGIIDFSGIEESIDQPVRTYSTGMQARLGFSIVAHMDPEILLIDEILSVGDIEFQGKCHRRILEFKEKGVTMVFVSHSMGSVRMVCDSAMWLDERTIRMIGEAEEVVSAYAGGA
ncbi:MAG: ABC transporter ATP-binding protein [Deltaproteobacteria bacterium]|nr:ABC transporter ATP-binding protein [Deltaproteobacteria bacterium]